MYVLRSGYHTHQQSSIGPLSDGRERYAARFMGTKIVCVVWGSFEDCVRCMGYYMRRLCALYGVHSRALCSFQRNTTSTRWGSRLSRLLFIANADFSSHVSVCKRACHTRPWFKSAGVGCCKATCKKKCVRKRICSTEGYHSE